jgi:hypothetical protein
MPIFLKVNHQLESRMRENRKSGSEGGANPGLSLPLSSPRKNRPVGHGMVGRRPNPRDLRVDETMLNT